MTVNQMVCHLSDAYRVPTGERACRPSGKLVHHTLLRWVALHTPMTWPKGAKTAPDLDQAIGGTKPTDFDGFALEPSAHGATTQPALPAAVT